MPGKLFIIIFLMLIFVGLAGFIAIRLGYFPVAVVNAWPVDEGDFNRAADEIISSFNDSAAIPPNSELRRLTLQKVIEDQLVLIEAKKYFSSKLNEGKKPEEARNLIQNQVDLLGSTFDSWLTKAKQRANVIILISGFKWSDGKVLACSSDNTEKNSTGLISPVSIFTSC